ncbi:hypothetical protein LTR93_006839 [Exophiala xenobiotica]|nr:hypothetical protein LTR93_006839 [Exophiala xenobiotica]
MASTSKSGIGLPEGVFSREDSTKNEQLGRQESIEIAGQVQELQADQALEHLGYAPELSRNRSTFHVAFMSFVLASMPYGLATTLFYPLINGGSATVIWGFAAVSLIIICVACSLGEITSVYPTAGGVYYQTFMLSPVRWRRLAAWICGWAYVAGNVVITLAVSFGTTSFVVACINVFEMEPGLGIFQASTYQIYLLFLAITVLCTATSAFGNQHLPKLDAFATVWTIAALIAIAACTLAIAKNGRHSAKYVFADFEPLSGWTPGWAFCVGLLQAGYATSSTGMIISMCEETRHPSTQVPKAMVGTVMLNTLAGLLFLIPLMFVLPDLDILVNLASGQPLPSILKSAIGSSGGAFGLLLPLIIMALTCGIGCTTATSRCIYAFARDGGIPGSGWWKKVDRRLGVPLNALLLSAVVQILLGLIYFGSTAAFNAFSGAGVIFLTVSYAVPIAVSLFGGRAHVKTGQFYLGAFGTFCNVVALVVTETVNYAAAVFCGVVALAAAWYWAWGQKHYRGPPVNGRAMG